jgi:hypothetical protein
MKFILPSRLTLFFIAISIFGLLLIVKFSGLPKLTYDSVAYLEASESFSTYFFGQNADHHTYLYRPPVLPLYFHFFHDKILAAKWLNAACYILSLWLCYFVGRVLKFEAQFIALAIVLLASSYPWLQNHFFVWSEPVFGMGILFLVLIILTNKSWVWIASACVLLYLTRKVGLFVTTGVMAGCILNREYKTARNVGMMFALVFVFWELMTLFFSGTSPSHEMFDEFVGQTRWYWADVITAWVLPRNIVLWIRITSFLALLTLAIYFSKNELEKLSLSREIKTVFSIFIVYILSFVIFIGVAEYSEAERYLSVIIPLGVLLSVSVIRLSPYRKYLLSASIVWIAYPISRLIYHLL